MFKNYLKSAVRNLLKNKFFSIINIFGLVIGLVCSLLIFQYIIHQLSYDNFHEKGESLYRVRNDHYAKGSLETESAVTYAPVGPAMKAELPEVVDFVRFRLEDGGTFTYNNPTGAPVTFNEEKVYYTDPSLFSTFSFPLIKGDASTALSSPNTAVISEKTAHRYFGNEDPIGKTIKWNYRKGEHNFVINGVFKDVPSNSHLKFDFLLSFKTLLNIEAKSQIPLENNWGWPAFYTYVLLRPNSNVEAVEAKFPNMIEKYNGKQLRMINHKEVFTLQPLRDIHLYSHLLEEAEVNGDGQAIYFLLLVALFILLLAWANYINLSTARAANRAKEVGVRKVIGAQHKELMMQFLFESLVLNALAAFLAFIVFIVILPFFKKITETDFGVPIWSNIPFWFVFLVIVVAGALLSGAYPAFIISSFRPIEVLKGKINLSSARIPLRRILVTFQFIISITLISGTFVVFDQLSFMRSQNLGMSIDQVLVIKGPKVLGTNEGFAERSQSFKNEIQKYTLVKGVTVSSSIPGKLVKKANMFKRKEDDWQNGKVIHVLEVDYTFFSMYQIPLLAGRNFSETRGLDNNDQHVIVNESAANLLGFTKSRDAINAKIDGTFSPTQEIIGVVKNHHQRSLQNDYEPLVFLLKPATKEYYQIKLEAKNISSTVASIESEWDQFFPGNPYDYFFLNEFFNKQYKVDQQFGQVFGMFTFMAIVVACLGLLGLTTFTISQRAKEIGIRKVLGASIASVVLLLTKDFLQVIGIAFLLSCCIAYYFSGKWLQQYVFRIDLNAWHFILPGFLVLLIALFTISFQTVKIAQSNPLKSLRQE